MRIAVVGAGIAGNAAAWALAREAGDAREVVLYERDPRPGGHAHTVEIDGKPVAEIALDLDRLTGQDYANAEREALLENANIPALDARLHSLFQSQLAARASGIPVEKIRALGVRDYGEVCQAVRDFFIESD